MKVVLGAGVLILVIAFAVVYIQQTNKPSATTPIAPNTIVYDLTFDGNVVSTDESKSEIVVVTSSKQLTINIDPQTVITETISLTSDNGVIEDTKSREVNVSDVKVGTTISATFAPFKDGSSPGIIAIDFKTTQKLSDFNKQLFQLALSAESLFISGQVVRIDAESNVLEYKTLVQGGVSTTTKKATLIDKIPVYSVDSAQRANILHARTPATLSDIKAGMPVRIMIDVKSLQETSPTVKELVLLNTGI